MHYQFYNTQNPCFDYDRRSMTLGPITFVIETNMELDYSGFYGSHSPIRSTGEVVIACVMPCNLGIEYPDVEIVLRILPQSSNPKEQVWHWAICRPGNRLGDAISAPFHFTTTPQELMELALMCIYTALAARVAQDSMRLETIEPFIPAIPEGGK